MGRYIAELRVSDGTAEETTTVGDLNPLADTHDLNILGLVRRGKRQPGFSAAQEIRASDFLVVEGEPKNIEAFMAYVQSLRPSAAKGTYVRNVVLTATNSPAISVAA